MCPFDLDDLNPSARFYWGDLEEEWVDLRLAADVDTERLRKKAGIKQSIEYRRDRGSMHRIDFVNSDEKKLQEFTELLNDFIIKDWRLMTKEGEEIPCTAEAKNKMMRGSPAFAEWIASCSEKLRGDIGAKEDRELKNSESTLRE